MEELPFFHGRAYYNCEKSCEYHVFIVENHNFYLAFMLKRSVLIDPASMVRHDLP